MSVVHQFIHSPYEKHIEAFYQIFRYLKSNPGKGLFFKRNSDLEKNKKQGVVAKSSAEANFRAMAQGICEGLWIYRVLEELEMAIELPLKL